MAVIDFQEDRMARTATKDRLNTRYVRKFIIQTDDGSDDQPTVLAYSGVPQYGAGHPNDDQATVRNYSLQPHESKTVWHLTVNYERSTVRLPGNNTSEVTDPLDEPAEVSWGFSTIAEVVTKDKDGNTMANTFGHAFEYGSFTRDLYLPTLSISRIESDYSVLFVDEFTNSVNSGPVRVAGQNFASRTLVCNGIPAQRVLIQGEQYWRVEYLFIAKKDKWDIDALDIGYFHKKDDGTGEVRYKAADGHFRVTPGPLNGVDGKKSSDGSYSSVPTAFRVRTEANFKKLGLASV